MPTLANQQVTGPAGRLHVVDTNTTTDELPVLFLHGINMSHDVWLPVLDLLPEDRRYIAVDLRGHGRSDRDGPFGAEDYAADAVAVLDTLGVEKAHVVGTSFGGSVACVLAAAAPQRVATVTAIGSALKVEGVDVDAAVGAMHAVGLRAFFESFLPQASFAPATDPSIVARAVEVAVADRSEEVVVAVSRAAFAADVTDAAHAVSCPALVVVGEHDGTCPPVLAEVMAEALRAKLVVMPGRGHVVTYEDPAGVCDALLAHLESAAAQPIA
jgi:3-oxoadipate enol-lactonase